MNINLLQKVKHQIEKNPDLFSLEEWETPMDGYTIENVEESFGTEPERVSALKIRLAKDEECKSMCCIAGWSLAICNVPTDELTDYHAESCKKLCLTKEQGEELFFSYNWPECYRVPFRNADSYLDQAKIAASMIDYFIQKHS